MALSQSAVSELLEAFRTGEGVDLIRETARMVMQELIQTEATERIGAAKYERTESRTTERNGGRDRLMSTQAGDVELRIPKLRKGSFFPVILEPRRRIDQALYPGDGGPRLRRLDPQRRRPGRRAWHRLRNLRVGGLEDLRRPRRGRDRVPDSAAGPHR